MNTARLELATFGSGGRRSIQMSYVSDGTKIPQKDSFVQRLENPLAGARVLESTWAMTLETLLDRLLRETELPYLDRWFAGICRENHWNIGEQRVLWDGLRRSLAGALGLVPAAKQDGDSSWALVRGALMGKSSQWVRATWKTSPSTPTEAGVPGWLLPQWDARVARSKWSPEQQLLFLGSQILAAPFHVRLSPSPAGMQLRELWLANGKLTIASDGALICGGEGRELPSPLRNGLCGIQDGSSQKCLLGMDLRPGLRVWDVCAGNGGKTLLAAEALENRGVLVATDIASGKLKNLKERVRRSGWQNIRLQHWDGENLRDFGREVEKRAGFDRVIVDAPCSATGTWRRDPEARYRITRSGLSELTRHQSRLLSLGWSALKPGGQLVYITCSWLPEENEAQVEAFLERNPGRLLNQSEWGLPHDDANSMFSAVLQKPLR